MKYISCVYALFHCREMTHMRCLLFEKSLIGFSAAARVRKWGEWRMGNNLMRAAFFQIVLLILDTPGHVYVCVYRNRANETCHAYPFMHISLCRITSIKVNGNFSNNF